MLSNLRVVRFKRLKDLDLDLEPITVLVGANNSGKSSVLQAVQFAVSAAQTLRNARWTRGRKPGSIAGNELIYAPLQDVSALAWGGRLEESADTAIKISLTDDDHNSCTVTAKKGRNKNTTFNIEGAPLGRKLEVLSPPFSILVPGLAGVPGQEDHRPLSYVRKAAARGDANSVLRNVLFRLKQDGAGWRQFREQLDSVFPGTTVDVEFDEEQDDKISATLKASAGRMLPIDAAGTGVLQVIQILSYVNWYKPELMLLDEPDAHLHPNNQRTVARVLKDLVTDSKLQVIIATHSRHMLDALSPDSQLTWISRGQVAESQPTSIQMLLDLGALDDAERLRVGEAHTVVLTEDKDPSALKVLLVRAGADLDRLYIWSYRGCSKIDVVVGVADFIRTIIPEARIVVHRDRDYMSDDDVKDYTEALAKHGFDPFVTASTDIESYFVTLGHLSALNPEIDRNVLMSLIDTAEKEQEAQDIERLTNYLFDTRRRAGDNPAAGPCATDARRAFDEDPQRHRQGKSMVKALRRLSQSSLGRAIRIVEPSDCLHAPAGLASALGVPDPAESTASYTT